MADPQTPNESQVPEPAKKAAEFLNNRSKIYTDDQARWLIPDECKEIPENWRAEFYDYISSPVTPSSLTEVSANFRTLASFGFITIHEMKETEVSRRHEMRVRVSSKNGRDFIEWYDASGRVVRKSDGSRSVELEYSPKGYLTKIRQWQYGGYGHQDEFTYESANGDQKVKTMTRRLFSGLGGGQPSSVLGPPIEIDLQKGEFITDQARQPLPEIGEVDFNEPFAEVTSNDNRSGIICSSTEELIRILVAFGGEREAFNGDVDSRTLGTGGAEAAHLFDQLQSDSEGIKRNIKRILLAVADNKDIPAEILNVEDDKWDKYSGGPNREIDGVHSFHFDYDGFGGFHKSFIEVKKLPNKSYVIAMSQGPLGDRAEQQIAASFGIRRLLKSASINCIAALKDEIYAIDFQEIIGRVLNKLGLRANESHVTQMVFSDGFSTRNQGIKISVDKDTELVLRIRPPDDSERLTEPKHGNPIGIETQQGRMLGYPTTDWYDENAVSVPSFSMTLKPKQKFNVSMEQEQTLIDRRNELLAEFEI